MISNHIERHWGAYEARRAFFKGRLHPVEDLNPAILDYGRSILWQVTSYINDRAKITYSPSRTRLQRHYSRRPQPLSLGSLLLHRVWSSFFGVQAPMALVQLSCLHSRGHCRQDSPRKGDSARYCHVRRR